MLYEVITQIFSKGAQLAGDEIWVARYFLERTAEKYGVYVDFHPKPLGKDADWNGSGMHANFRITSYNVCYTKLLRCLVSR